MVEPIVLEKRCCRCKNIKPTAEFHRLATQPDGLQKRCKVCAAESNHRYGQSANGKACRRATNRAWFKTANGRLAAKRRYTKVVGTHEEKARSAVRRATTSGKLPKPSSLLCKHCGKQAEE